MQRSSMWARRAMVSTSSPLAVEAALWAWREGGTAVDAAIASDAVLGVVQPFWTGIGGDLFCLVADGDEVVAFNGSGAAPAGLTLAGCQAAAADPGSVPDWVAGDFPVTLPDTSALAVTVPGVVDGWAQLSERFGRLPLGTVLEPARRLAAEGFPVGRVAAWHWQRTGHKLRPGGPLPATVEEGERVANPVLAASLAAIASGGPAAHYGGRWAEEAVGAVRAEGGALAEVDLAAHKGEWGTPIAGAYRGYEVLEHPPNGQGGAVLAALRHLDRDAAPTGAERLAVLMSAVREGMRLAHRHVADPRTGAVPAFWSDTVYTAAVADGMAVSLISSVFHLFGSGLTAGGAPLQNRGLGFSLDPASPNCAAPGKRPFHTIIPALVRRDGRVWAALGVVGGPMQPQGHVQVLNRLIDEGDDPQAALDAPRARWLGGDVVALEAGAGGEAGEAVTGGARGGAGGGREAATAALREAGFTVLDGQLHSAEFGSGQVVRVHGDGWLEGGADSRRDGAAFGG
ncbi:MAG TPA: gamma-glutamyltransferase [Acidimicrobiales bacterium]|nr:gamma-glutamyltransferase [Acidimicrobiales bacterium]